MGCGQSSDAKELGPHARTTFNSSLVSKVDQFYAMDPSALDIREMVMLMWQCRSDHVLIERMIDLLVMNSNRRHLFDGMEFYLPQIAHMIIHLETSWPKNAMQAFSLVIAQHSMHFSLQLNWILTAAMEDYQPEDESGARNPKGDAMLFGRCANLLHQLERAVVYGHSSEADSLLMIQFKEGKISKDQLNLKRIEERHRLAREISEHEESDDATVMLAGVLKYKRWTKAGVLSKKSWKDRRFRIQYRVLHCFRISDGALKRVIPLHHTTVTIKKHHTHKWYFELQENQRDRVYKMVAPDEATRDQWIQALEQAGSQPAKYQTLQLDNESLTPSQQIRHQSFQTELGFVRALTDICEELRFVPVEQRKPALRERLEKLEVPKDAYIPLCKSTDPWLGLTEVLADKGHPFSTRERCPCLMTFKAIESNVDVAHFLRSKQAVHGTAKQQNIEENADTDTELAIKDTEQEARVSRAVSTGSMLTSLWQAEDDAVAERYHDGVDSVNKNSSTRVPVSPPKAPAGEDSSVRLIAKSFDDLRQEVFVVQMLQFFQDVWSEAKLEAMVIPHQILSTSRECGLLEVVQNANSIDGIKKDSLKEDATRKLPQTLSEYFDAQFPEAADRVTAVDAYMKTLAGYSVATYVLGIKDRHNGNIMLKNTGHVVHIDFGFVLGMAPGKDKVPYTNFSMERAAFKLTPEMSAVFGGVQSDNWKRYSEMCVNAFLALREHATTITTLTEVMAYKSILPCFNQPGGGGKRCLNELRSRLMMKSSKEQAAVRFAKRVRAAHGHTGTMLYEKFQMKSNGIEPVH